MLNEKSSIIDQMNYYGKKRLPFLFIIDFNGINYQVLPIKELFNKNIFFNINGISNYQNSNTRIDNFIFKKYPVSFSQYEIAFNIIIDNQRSGNSYLANLTFPTTVETDITFLEIFSHSSAKYKLFFKDEFIVFSPESFIKIDNGTIKSFPMKGTIDASLYDAENIILNDEKELAEHITIVDLIRNDLNKISKQVGVDRFRYIDKIETHDKTLLQVSSEISGKLPAGYNNFIGNIITELLPAGSVTGAPKKKTVEIIKKAEQYDRGYYTGVFGYFDGTYLDSAVMIRFMEKNGNKTYYKSGGGITVYSDAYSEYREMIDKVYVPIIRSS